MILHGASWKLVEHSNAHAGTGVTTVEDVTGTFCHGNEECY